MITYTLWIILGLVAVFATVWFAYLLGYACGEIKGYEDAELDYKDSRSYNDVVHKDDGAQLVLRPREHVKKRLRAPY